MPPLSAVRSLGRAKVSSVMGLFTETSLRVLLRCGSPLKVDMVLNAGSFATLGDIFKKISQD